MRRNIHRSEFEKKQHWLIRLAKNTVSWGFNIIAVYAIWKYEGIVEKRYQDKKKAEAALVESSNAEPEAEQAAPEPAAEPEIVEQAPRNRHHANKLERPAAKHAAKVKPQQKKPQQKKRAR